MKKIIGTGLLALTTVMAQAQGLTQTSEGTGSVLFRGSYFSLDVAKTEINAGYNTVDKTIGEDHTWFFGAALKGKNEEGLTNLFSKGDLVPASAFNAYAGYSWSNAVNYRLRRQQDIILEQRKAIQAENDSTFVSGMLEALYEHRIDLNRYPDFFNALEKQIMKMEGSRKVNKLLEAKDEDDQALKNVKKELLEKSNELQVAGQARLDVIDAASGAIGDEYKKIPYIQFLAFGYGGIDAMEFKRFTGADTINLKNSFADQSFRGGNFGLGINLHVANWMLGATYDYIHTNNFALLTSKDYTLRQSTTGGNQQLIEEKKVTAYTGNYDEVEINRFRVDLIGNFKLDKEAKNHLLVNPYFRANLSSRNTVALPNSMNAGVGLYFFQETGKLLGGFYVELPDVQNNFEKAKPLADQNLREPVKRLTFGFVGKFSFSTLLRALNGPQ